jgi:hypothetical protein
VRCLVQGAEGCWGRRQIGVASAQVYDVHTTIEEDALPLRYCRQRILGQRLEALGVLGH